MKRFLTLALASTILSGFAVNNAQARCSGGSCGVRLAILKKAPRRVIMRVRHFPRSARLHVVRGMAIKRAPKRLVKVRICRSGSCFVK